MPGPEVKNWDLYYKLRKKGYSKEAAARLANTASKEKRK